MLSIDDLTSIMVDNNSNKETVYDPMEIMSGNITPEPSFSIEFSNYDVLLMPCEADEPVRFAPGNHVGNQRFRVLLSLFRRRYLQAVGRGDEDE
mmetsp:Transcript_28233/g.60159  ORF Transcript_28233/g.60159 Transcript_28233/m.60159 type:complete len:94 (-) Transcript_28233:14-295(-)